MGKQWGVDYPKGRDGNENTGSIKIYTQEIGLVVNSVEPVQNFVQWRDFVLAVLNFLIVTSEFLPLTFNLSHSNFLLCKAIH